MKKTELVFISMTAIGHLWPMVALAKHLANRDERLSVTVLITQEPLNFGAKPFIQSLTSSAANDDDDTSNSNSRIKFVKLHLDDSLIEELAKSPQYLFTKFIDSHKPYVRAAAADIIRSESSQLAGFVIDMFCTSMIDVANELGVPSYVYFTSSAGFLGFFFYVQALVDEHNKDITDYKDSDTELSIPSFIKPVPTKVVPSIAFDKRNVGIFLNLARRFKETKGIIVNTFLEMESHAIEALSDGKTPPIYPVGPDLNNVDDGNGSDEKYQSLMKWLDDQPKSSVVFLCFGSMGSFREIQVKEIAYALEQSGHGFLWSVRKPSSKVELALPREYEDLEEVLPEGFLERTAGRGKIIGWAPQLAVLSHPAIGGFLSHCGWNSTLESVWSGVPMATWPLFAEQQLNAFLIVKQFGIGVEVKMDYIYDYMVENPEILQAELIESAIRKLMAKEEDDNTEFRKRMKEMSEKSRMSMAEGGSSHAALGRLIEDIINNISH